MHKNEYQSTTNTRWHKIEPQPKTNMRWIALVASGLLATGCILLILSNALPSWGVPSIPYESLSIGLWRNCRRFGWRYYNDNCFTSPLTSCSGVPSLFLGECLKLMVTRAFIIMACVFSGFGAIFLVVIGIIGKGNPRLIILGKVLVFVSLIFSIIGFSVGISWVFYHYGRQLGAAAILAIIAAGLNVVSAVLVLMI